MKEYKCIKDFYIEDVKFASQGDVVKLLQDGTTVVNTSGDQRVTRMPGILTNKNHFIEVKHTEAKAPVTEDKVNHPSHYTWLKEKCGIEVIDITRWLDFDTGNAVKYLLRAGHKSEEGMTDREKTIQDLKKAIWYIHDRIKMLEDGTDM